MSSENRTKGSQAPTYAGIFFVLLIMGLNLTFSLSPEKTREYLTASLRSPHGDTVRSVLNQLPAFRVAGRTAVMDVESFVRLQTLANYLVLTAFFFYMSFLRGLSESALRLSMRLFFIVGLTYAGVLVFDSRPIGHEGSAIHWFQSVGIILAAAAALVNYLLVRSTMPGREGLGLRIFWGAATACFTLAALDSRFQVQEHVTNKVKAWMLTSNVITYSSVGYEAVDRYFMVGVLALALITLAAFQRPIAKYRELQNFDGWKPLYFALMFFALAALSHAAQANGKLQVYLSHLEDMCRLASVVLFLASFASVAASYVRFQMNIADVDATSSHDMVDSHSHASMQASMHAPHARRQAPVVIQEQEQEQEQEADQHSDEHTQVN